MERGCFLAVALTISVTLSAQAYAAEEAKPHITGIYSDLYYNVEGGDLLGTEIFVVYADNDKFAAFIQSWAGSAYPPVIVPVKVTGDAISFAVPAPSGAQGLYKGRINKNGFDGTVTRRLADGSSKSEPIHLKRKQSYWQ